MDTVAIVKFGFWLRLKSCFHPRQETFLGEFGHCWATPQRLAFADAPNDRVDLLLIQGSDVILGEGISDCGLDLSCHPLVGGESGAANHLTAPHELDSVNAFLPMLVDH